MLSDAEYAEVSDTSYIVSYDDATLALKRAAGENKLFFDLTSCG